MSVPRRGGLVLGGFALGGFGSSRNRLMKLMLSLLVAPRSDALAAKVFSRRLEPFLLPSLVLLRRC